MKENTDYRSCRILGSFSDRFIKEGYFVMGMDNLITGDLKK
jgi:hypothetical protein